LLARLQERVQERAPTSLLACSLERANEETENSQAVNTAGKNSQSSRERQAKDVAIARERLRRCPADWSSLVRVWHSIQMRARMGEAGVGSVEDLAIIDQMVSLRQTSPDAGIEFPPLQTAIARVYVAGKVRLSAVAKLLDAGLQAIERQEKYRPSM